MIKLTVSGQVVDLRSDHLKAVFEYALVQATTSEIQVLNFGDNEQGLELDEQIDYIKEVLTILNKMTADGNKDLLLVNASQQQLQKYFDSY